MDAKKILFVDDEEEILRVANKIFENTDFELTTFSNPQDALSSVDEVKYDLIITDLNMPEIKGEEFISQIRAFGLNGKTPVLVLSANIDRGVKEFFSEVSKIYYFEKPIKSEMLLDKIKMIFEGKSLQLEVDVSFLNPILESTVKVMSQMIQLHPTPGQVYLKESGEVSGDISGIVGVSSSTFSGSIAISFPKDTFLKVVSKMMMSEITEIDDEIKDAVAELLNIIFGHAKKTLNENGMDINPAIPSIIIGERHMVDHVFNLPVMIIPFSTDVGGFKVEICGTKRTKVE